MSSKTFDSQIGGTTASLEICVILVHLKNAKFPIFLTLFGMVTEVRDTQREKALALIFVTLFGMVTEVRDLQSSKALQPISVTLFGMLIEVRRSHQ